MSTDIRLDPLSADDTPLAHTAVLTMEMQRGIAGDLATMAVLREAMAEQGTVTRAAAVCGAARAAGIRVVHCTAVTRPDGAGRGDNCRLLRATAATAAAIEVGTPGAQIMPELDPHPDDIEMSRLHGLTPFTGTGLDQLLRNLGVHTVVAVGNSLNLGVLGLALSAVDLGYRVVVPHDAVIGIPVSYGHDVITHSLRMLASITDTATLTAEWAGSSSSS